MKKRMLYLIVCLSMIAGLTACQKIDGDGMVYEADVQEEIIDEQELVDVPEDEILDDEIVDEELVDEELTEESDELSESDSQDSDDLEFHRQVLVNENSMCGVIFLGYVDASKGSLAENKEYLASVLEENECDTYFKFVYNIPDERIIETENGSELYCIYPLDPNASVAVSESVFNTETLETETGAVLYRSDYGDPILLRCNASELVYDTQIGIVDNQGNVLSWQPGISLMDGQVRLPTEAPYIFDSTNY